MAEEAPSTKELQKALKLKEIEIANLKEKVALLEMDVGQAQKQQAQRSKENLEIQALKTQSEGILTKAKAMIFENTKIIKNQELQIEALAQQNESLKDVVKITKDLLEIRNMEVNQLEEKMNCMEGRIKADKERQTLLHTKLETMIRHNGDLKREYETQLCLFNALRERYNERELARGVVEDLRRDVQNEVHQNVAANANPVQNGAANANPEQNAAANANPEQNGAANTNPEQNGNANE